MKLKDIDKIKVGNINIWNIRTRITPEGTRKNYRIMEINLAPNLNLSFVQNTIEDLI
jgi:hypothetical protein